MQTTLAGGLHGGGARSPAVGWPRLAGRRGNRRSIDCVRNQAAMLGSTIILVLVLIALFAPHSSGSKRPIMPARVSLHPTRINWAGTDVLGRDVFSRIMLGTRISL